MKKDMKPLNMKAFINNLLVIIVVASFVTACTKKEEPAAQADVTLPAVEETVQVPESSTETPAVVKTESVASNKTLYPGEVVNQLKKWDQQLSTLRTDFVQTTSYDGVQISRSQGTLYYDKKTPLLRLDTTNTDGAVEQSAVTDKRQIIILDESAQPVTTLSWEEWQKGQPNQALFDFGNYTALLARHDVKLPQRNLLVLTPKEGEPYTLSLTLSAHDYFPTSIKIESDLMTTQADLTNTQKNTTLAESTFGGFFK